MKFHASLTVLVPSSRALCDFLFFFFFIIYFFFILMFNYLKAHKPSKMKSAWPKMFKPYLYDLCYD